MDAPNIAAFFPHLQERALPGSLGLPVLSDWADMPDDHELKLYKNCGFLNRDEAAILYQCVRQLPGRWLDIGAHTGWTALHMAAAGANVVALDPMLGHAYFLERAVSNLARSGLSGRINLRPWTSRLYFQVRVDQFSGVMIDGDHCWMNPLQDAVWAFKHVDADGGVIVLHDFIGGPVREAVKYLMCEGMKCRIYCASSQLLAVCWHDRCGFIPPDYTPNPSIDWQTVLTPLAATKLVGFENGRAIADPAATQGVGDFYFELCS